MATTKAKTKMGEITRAEIAKELLNNPMLTDREIADKLGKDRSTITVQRNKLSHVMTPYDFMQELLEGDAEVQKLALNETKRRLTEEKERITLGEVTRAAEFSFKRSQVFLGKPTEILEVNGQRLEALAELTKTLWESE